MKTALVLATSLAIAPPALAQDAADDWALTVKPEDRLTLAHTEFDNGLLLAARCQADTFQVLIGGLPEAPAARDLMSARRVLGVGFGDKPVSDEGFMIGDNRHVAFAELPAPLARSMREGGRMQVVVAGGAENGGNLRYVVDLPPSNAAIDQTLSACGRPLVDPRDEELKALGDDGLPVDIAWRRMPETDYPEGRTFTAGFAVATCLARPDGRVSDCVVETEFPANGGFGAAVLKAAQSGRLENRDGGPVPLTRIVYRTNFRMGDSMGTTGARIRGGRSE
ncbi:hypothetical protein [Brevundimonas sp.]|uniref:hypothetical protein n=1 Tax=Brevundimonas sp. TaxID=1871086 RepID=UPI003D6CAD7B